MGFMTMTGEFVPLEQWITSLAIEKIYVVAVLDSIDGVFMEDYVEPTPSY